MGYFDDIDLPAHILQLIEFSPIEDLVKAYLEPQLAPISVVTAIEPSPPFPYVLVRRLSTDGDWTGDARGFYDSAKLAVHVYTGDPDGDLKGSLLSEAIRVLLRDAVAQRWVHPDLGCFTKVRMTMEPTRRPDWATSTGPVQYADLPTGSWRYESHYELTIRAPR